MDKNYIKLTGTRHSVEGDVYFENNIGETNSYMSVMYPRAGTTLDLPFIQVFLMNEGEIGETEFNRFFFDNSTGNYIKQKSIINTHNPFLINIIRQFEKEEKQTEFDFMNYIFFEFYVKHLSYLAIEQPKY